MCLRCLLVFSYRRGHNGDDGDDGDDEHHLDDGGDIDYVQLYSFCEGHFSGLILLVLAVCSSFLIDAAILMMTMMVMVYW